MTDIVERLRSPEVFIDTGGMTSPVARLAADEIERLRKGYAMLNREVCQSLGKALGYPWFKDDQENFPGATEENGVCTGEHVAETIAAEAARRIGNLEAELDEAIQRGNDWCDQARKLRDEREAWQIGRDTRDRARAALKETGRE